LSDREPKTKSAGRPSVCRSCGAIVGAGQNACAMCGASLTSNQPRAPRLGYDREAVRFARAVLSRPYIFTIVFLVANFFIFLLMWHSNGMSTNSLWVFPEPVLIAYGAKVNAKINQEHQWWRFVTPMFVHVGLLHLLVNMYSLWVVGPYVEKFYGSAKFVFFWVVTGVAGVVASYLTVVRPGTPVSAAGRFIFKTQDGPSAGASGALFGLIGVLFVFGIKFRHELPEGFKRAFGAGLLPVIMINLFIGFLARGLIDNAAHLGGLISGAALALVVGYRRPGERTGLAMTWNFLQVAALALVAISFVKAAQHVNDTNPSRNGTEALQPAPGDRETAFKAFAKAMNDGQEALNNGLTGDQSGIDAAVKELEQAPAPDQTAGQLKGKLVLLLQRAKQPERTSSPEVKGVQQQRDKIFSDFESWEKDYGEWLKTLGKTQPSR
jgi:rhomboid protease GluP